MANPFSIKTSGTGALSIRDRQMAELVAQLVGAQIAAALAEDRAARITSTK